MALNTKYLALFGGGATAVAGGSAGIYYLSQDKTIKDRLISQGHSIIETDDEYEVSFKEFKKEKTYINLIKGTDSSLNENSDLSVGRVALKKWCEDNLKLDLTENNIKKALENTKKYCTKPPLTIEDKLPNLKKALVKNWKDKLNNIKSEKEPLLTDLKKINDKINTLDDSGDIVDTALKDWCNSKIKTKLSEDKKDDIWNKVEKRCLESVAG